MYKKEAYYYLFGAGLVAALGGVLMWLFFQLQMISFYPRMAHANLMFFGFFGAFISGFLMTAVPKMTKTSPASGFEISSAILFVAAHVVVNYFNQFAFSVDLFALQILFLAVFILRRFLVFKKLPFEGFVFMPMAFLNVFVGYTLFKNSEILTLSQFYLLAGEAFILNLICGLGSRLIPVLSRVPDALNPDVQSKTNNIFAYVIAALILNFSFVIEISEHSQTAALVRFLFIVIFAARYFKIFQMPSTKTFLGYGLKLSVFMMALGYFLKLTEAFDNLSSMHLVYIGGFTLVTLMVATRVSLAHGGHSTAIESSSRTILFVAAGLGLASFVRMWAASPMAIETTAALLVFVCCSAAWYLKFYHRKLS